jgi:DNA helicase HerA-like ATPase
VTEHNASGGADARMKPVFPKEILPKHTAILGMTGSGKSTTARDLVEQVAAEAVLFPTG